MAIVPPLLTFARGLFGLFTLTSSPVEMESELAQYKDMTCDDGETILNEDDYVREDCTIDGCAFRDEVCYFNGFEDECLDHYGRPTGVCEVKELTCGGIAACFVLWVECEGKYSCTTPALVGCRQGKCVEKGD